MQEPKIPGGYILISRKIVESEIWDKPPLYIKVWVYLLVQAQHKQYKGLKRGQLYTSIPEIIEACSWRVGYRKEKPSKDQVFQVIDWLRKSHESVYETETKATMITTTKATQGLLIDIDNYGFYQDPKHYESNDESNNEESTKATRKQQQPDNTNKNVKNVKNDKNVKPSRHKQVYDEESVYYQLALRLFNRIKENDPNHKQPNLQKWANDVRLMIEKDKREEKQITYLIDWTQQDSFWKSNILSISKLRKQFDQLKLKAIAEHENKKHLSKQKKLISTEKPEHVEDPTLPDDVDEQIKSMLDTLS